MIAVVTAAVAAVVTVILYISNSNPKYQFFLQSYMCTGYRTLCCAVLYYTADNGNEDNDNDVYINDYDMY